eukprot:1149327-Pelagomonas_calceolata.AAC.2
MARLVKMQGMGSIDSPTHTQEDCVESNLNTLKLFVQFALPGWNCAASYFFNTSHAVEYPIFRVMFFSSTLNIKWEHGSAYLFLLLLSCPRRQAQLCNLILSYPTLSYTRVG